MYLVFALPAFLLALYAQWRVSSAYSKYLNVPNDAGMTGMQAAQYLLRTAGLRVSIEGAPGTLTDHYDPRKNVLRLSSDVERSASVGAVAIVAHEIGHAVQDAQAFALLRLRSGLVPMVNFTSWLGPIFFFLGFLFRADALITLGLFSFLGAVVFSLVTLPVELDASRRAMKLLEQSGILRNEQSLRGAKRVLSAAALTYVASLMQAISTMLYYLTLMSGRRRRS
jgi:hypothetical protein